VTAFQNYAPMNPAFLHWRQTHVELWRRWQSLSPSEQDVPAMARWDYSNRQIAALLRVKKTMALRAIIRDKLRGLDSNQRPPGYEHQFCVAH